MNNPKLLEIRQGVLGKNDQLAAALRTRFRREGTYAVNLVSGPGSGKTALLEATLRLLRAQGYQPAALVGDLATENDAARLARSGAPARQIVTAGTCHLEAAMIAGHLEGWLTTPPDFLFIENVGNLVCPTSWDLGESVRAALLAVTEGEDKPLKYPVMFRSADAIVVNKVDLLPHLDFDIDLFLSNVEAVNPGVTILKTSARTGEGVDEVVAWLSNHQG